MVISLGNQRAASAVIHQSSEAAIKVAGRLARIYRPPFAVATICIVIFTYE